MPAGGFTRPRDRCERARDFHEFFTVRGGVFLVPGEPHADRKITPSTSRSETTGGANPSSIPARNRRNPGGNERNQGERIVAAVGDLIEKAVLSELLEEVLLRVR